MPAQPGIAYSHICLVPGLVDMACPFPIDLLKMDQANSFELNRRFCLATERM